MDKDRDLLIERLTHEAGSWKSIELKTNQDFVNSSGSQDPSMYQRAIYHEDYIETVLGQRFDRCLDVPAGGVEKLAEYYCDGVKRADVSFDAGAGSKQSQINIKKSFKYEAHYGMNFRPFPLRYLYYVGNIPLPRALKDAETLGPATVLGRPCETYLLRRFTLGLSPCDLVYTLDRESGVPLKLVGYNDAAGYTGGRPSWRWEALGVEQVQGHLFPAKSEEIVYFPRPMRRRPGSATGRRRFVSRRPTSSKPSGSKATIRGRRSGQSSPPRRMSSTRSPARSPRPRSGPWSPRWPTRSAPRCLGDGRKPCRRSGSGWASSWCSSA